MDGEEGYLFKYPFQSGIVFFYYLVMRLLGTENYVGLQVVNLLALTISYYLLVQILGRFWKEDKWVLIFVHAALILWVPYMFLCDISLWHYAGYGLFFGCGFMCGALSGDPQMVVYAAGGPADGTGHGL